MSPHTNLGTLLAVASIGFLVLSLVIAVLPALEMQETSLSAEARQPDEMETRGRALYLREGCGFCHTQFVRDLPIDRPYGRGSVAADYSQEDPPLLGTQRTGPDLANVGERQPSEVWNLIHLYNPRAVVPESAMPAYRWYFQLKDEAVDEDVLVAVPDQFVPSGKVVVATADAIALVRYLQSLRQRKIER